MADSPDLLAPIPGDRPGGVDLRYEPVYAQIKEARREEPDLPQGEYTRSRKLADWPLVIKLATEVLTTRSKDLWVAAWLTEALLWREGYSGFRRGCDLLRGLLADQWEHLHPEIEEGDVGARVGPIEWIGLKLDVAVRSVALTKNLLSYLDHQRAQNLGHEADVGDEYARQQAWQAAVAAGELTADAFDAAVADTPKDWYKTLVSNLGGVRESVAQLEAASDARFPNDLPAFTELKKGLEEVAHVARQLLQRKLELDPDPVEEQSADAFGEGSPGDTGATEAAPLSLEPVDRTDAATRVVAAARFLRRLDPSDPTPYLLLRSLRWGELRASGRSSDPRLLQPPPSAARVQLRTFYLDGRWPELLEAAEAIMGTPAGRGWLDLQRYALLACEQLGEDYSRVARAIRSELRVVLTEIPDLAGMTLMDDMPVATPETRTWLMETFAAEPAPPGVGDGEGDTASVATPARASAPEAAPGDRVHLRALGEVRAGRFQRGIEMLMHELDRETSPRGRFLRQAQVARIMVDHQLHAVAQPMLEEMLQLIEEHKLEEWELGALVAQPMTLMYRCLELMDGDSAQRQQLYLRICRLDPLTALDLPRS